MGTAPKPENEKERLAELRQLGILDSEPEDLFNDIVKLASSICNVPVALISLVDDEREWFKAKVGLDVCETSRDVAFCAHAILDRTPLVVPDATLDERFARNPLVTDDPKIRFYAGIPLWTGRGYPMGTLCIIDFKPRELSKDSLEMLATLARQVVSHLELRRHVLEHRADLVTKAELEHAVREARVDAETVSARLELALEGASLGIWDWDLRDNGVRFDRRWCEMLGLDHAKTPMVLKNWEERVHP